MIAEELSFCTLVFRRQPKDGYVYQIQEQTMLCLRILLKPRVFHAKNVIFISSSTRRNSFLRCCETGYVLLLK